MAVSAPGLGGALTADVGGGGIVAASLGKVSVAGAGHNASDALALKATGDSGGVTISAPGPSSVATNFANFTVRHTNASGLISGSAGEIAVSASSSSSSASSSALSLSAPAGDAKLSGKSVTCAAAAVAAVSGGVGVDVTGLRGALRVGATAATAAAANSGGVSISASDAPFAASTTGLAGTITVSAADARVEVTSSQPINDAVRLTAPNGGIALVGGGSAGIALTTTAAPITLAAAGAASAVTLAADDDDDHLTIALTGSHQAELRLNSDGVTGDAIFLNAKDRNGGVRIEAGTAGSGSMTVQTGIGGITLGTSGQGTLSATNGVSLRSSGRVRVGCHFSPRYFAVFKTRFN